MDGLGGYPKGGPDVMKGKDKGKGGPPPFPGHHPGDPFAMGKGAPHVPPVFPPGMDHFGMDHFGMDPNGWGHDDSGMRADAPSFTPGGPGYNDQPLPPPPPGKGGPRNDQMQWFQHAFAEKPAPRPPPMHAGFGAVGPPPPPPMPGFGGWGGYGAEG